MVLEILVRKLVITDPDQIGVDELLDAIGLSTYAWRG
jgi:hypothetical protein